MVAWPRSRGRVYPDSRSAFGALSRLRRVVIDADFPGIACDRGLNRGGHLERDIFQQSGRSHPARTRLHKSRHPRSDCKLPVSNKNRLDCFDHISGSFKQPFYGRFRSSNESRSIGITIEPLANLRRHKSPGRFHRGLGKKNHEASAAVGTQYECTQIRQSRCLCLHLSGHDEFPTGV